MSVSILVPVMVKSESSSELMFIDFASASLYDASGKPATEEQRDSVLADMRRQREAYMPHVPYDQIREVANTERNLSKDNAKHVFRRGF